MLEMWLRLGQTKKKLIITWRNCEKESNPEWIQNEIGQDTTLRKRKMVKKTSQQHEDKGEKKRTIRTQK